MESFGIIGSGDEYLTQDEFELKKVKYVKLVPKKFREDFEVHFQDVVKTG